MMRIGYSKKFRRKLFSAFIFNFERKRIINFTYFILPIFITTIRRKLFIYNRLSFETRATEF